MFVAALVSALATLPAAMAPPPSLRARISDPEVIRAAVRQATSVPEPARRQDQGQVLSGDAQPGFARAVDEARVPGCLNSDALKHQPPQIGIFTFTGMMALPFWLSAIVRGKCN